MFCTTKFLLSNNIESQQIVGHLQAHTHMVLKALIEFLARFLHCFLLLLELAFGRFQAA